MLFTAIHGAQTDVDLKTVLSGYTTVVGDTKLCHVTGYEGEQECYVLPVNISATTVYKGRQGYNNPNE